MTAGDTLPAAVLHALQAIIGEPISSERLGGMGQGRVYRARSARQSVIAKLTSPVEAHFYRVIVPRWPELQSFTPTLLAALEAEGHPWLVLEDILHPLPPERRLADPDMIAVLRLLHQSALPDLPATLAPYRPAWGVATNERALAALSARVATTLADNLGAMCDAAQPLFAPHCPLSGDPNPANWGLRDDGSLVLYDWERFCRGTPALDLAITVPGLGNMADYRRVAESYSADDAQAKKEQLAREIALAKVWSVVEFLAHNAGRGERTEATVAWIAQHFGDWLRSLVGNLTRS
jgi:hypothetical protein